jgi:hypothetical protein
MFISTDERSGGETKVFNSSQTKPSELWVLLVRSTSTLSVCIPGALGCMEEDHFIVLSALLKESPQKIRAQFVFVSETKKPQVLKAGDENDMRTLNHHIQFVACTCMFYFEVARSM